MNFCRQFACDYCRNWRLARWADNAVDEFGALDRNRLRFVTISLAPVADVTDVARVIRTAKVRLRNLVGAMRARDPRWNSVAVNGAVEVDWVAAHHSQDLGSDRTRLLNRLGFDFNEDVWWPCIHAVVDCGSAGAAAISAAFHERWAAANQVDVRELYDGDTADNIRALIRYGGKAQHGYAVHPSRPYRADVAWPQDRIVEYYEFLSTVGGGKLLRVQLRAKKKLKETSAVAPMQIFICGGSY